MINFKEGKPEMEAVRPKKEDPHKAGELEDDIKIELPFQSFRMRRIDDATVDSAKSINRSIGSSHTTPLSKRLKSLVQVLINRKKGESKCIFTLANRSSYSWSSLIEVSPLFFYVAFATVKPPTMP